MRRISLVVLFTASVLAASFAGPVCAQVDGYHLTGINFNFANPGARARGIGGAFVALADDATAGIANPAGLAFLDRQITLELARDEENTLVGQVTQGSVNVAEDDGEYTYTAQNDPYRVLAESQTNRINYASFVLPIPSANIGLAVYYAALADLRQDYNVGPGLMCLDNGSPYLPGAGSGCSEAGESDVGTLYTPFDVSTRLQSDLIGVGLGWKLGDTFSIGASIAYAQTSYSGTSTSTGIQDPAGNTITSAVSYTSSVDDNDVMYSLGLLYRGDVVGVGLNYRSATTFGIESETLDADGTPYPGRGFEGEFRIPERLSAGLAFFPGDHWVIAAEYVRIPYSTIPKGMPEQFNETREFYGVEYSSADANEYHLGAEYTTFSAGKGWSIRAGYWLEQSHIAFSSQGYNDPLENLPDDRFLAGAALLYQELNLNFDHFTAGFGASLGKFRVDLAVDYSPDAGTDFLVSGVFYF